MNSLSENPYDFNSVKASPKPYIVKGKCFNQSSITILPVTLCLLPTAKIEPTVGTREIPFCSLKIFSTNRI